ncbi:MAG: hypothetical protein ABWY52_07580 [Candidatus Limnocylindrales bacterium]
MSDQTWIIDRIERAERETPTCVQCHEPTVAEWRDGQMRLVCRSLSEPKSALRRLLSLDPAAWHTNQPIAGLELAA